MNASDLDCIIRQGYFTVPKNLAVTTNRPFVLIKDVHFFNNKLYLTIRAQPITGPKYHILGSSFGFERNSGLITKKGTNYDPTLTHLFENSPAQVSNFRNVGGCSDQNKN